MVKIRKEKFRKKNVGFASVRKRARAINLGIGSSDYGIRLIDSKGKFISLEDLSQDRLKKFITLFNLFFLVEL